MQTIEEYGVGNNETIVMLHGAYFIHTFARQYSLAKQYHIIVPHITGFGAQVDREFEADTCVKELADYIAGLNKKVMLVGFSLGAQLAFKLVSEYEGLFCSAILVSPWLIKEEPFLSEVYKVNLKQLAMLKKKWLCYCTGMANGVPPAQRREFVEQMQKLKAETVKNAVYNDITVENVDGFRNVAVPVIAIAGEKENKVMHESVQILAEINDNCKCEIWRKAGHNIPQFFAKRFNSLICSMMQ